MMTGKHVRVPISSLRRNSIRQNPGTEEELKALARSWLARTIHPIVVRHDMTVVDGHRRLAGLELLGETEVDVFVTEENLSDSDLLEAGVETAVHRKGLTGFEEWQAVAGIASAHPEWKLKDLADRLRIDPGMITRILSPSKDCKAVQQALKDGKITLSDCYEFSKMSEDDQLVALTKRLNGGTLEELKRTPKKRSAGPTVRTSRLKCPLPSGQTVTITGEEVSLDEAIEILAEASKAMREAVKKGITAKTFANAMADIAAAG